jgi:hypothetical protein
MNNKQLQKEIQRLEVDATEAQRMHNFELANAVSLEGDDDTKATIMHEDARRHEG